MLDSGNSVSYEQYVIDNEMIGMVKRILKGIEVSEETLGFDVIEKVGPMGSFIMEDHTDRHMMNEFFYPDLSIRSNFDIWEREGQPSMLSRAREFAERILEQERADLLHAQLTAELKEIFPGLQR